MKKLTKDDLLALQEYEREQPRFLKKVIEQKATRRVPISDKMTGLFETRLTVWYQIQEMIRAEQMTNPAFIDEMLEVYNELLPDDHEVSMTLFVEIPDQQELRTFNSTIVGIENHVELKFGDTVIRSYENADDADDETEETYTQSVHYLKFPFTAEQIASFKAYSGTVALRINHPNYQAETNLNAELVAQLQTEVTVS